MQLIKLNLINEKSPKIANFNLQSKKIFVTHELLGFLFKDSVNANKTR